MTSITEASCIAEPYRLWSLPDLERFRVASFGSAVSNLSRLGAALDLNPEEVVEVSNDWFVKHFDEAVDALENLLMYDRVLGGQARRVRAVLEAEPLDIRRSGILVNELINNVIMAYTSPFFLMLRERERNLFESDHPLGEAIHTAFPTHSNEIRAAARSLALDQWTAAVFHMMRVLELELRRLAGELDVEMKRDIELENWQNILTAIRAKVEQIGQEPRTIAREERMAFYNGAVSQFMYFKDAWRNHVSHTRATYDSYQAWSVWDHLRSYLIHVVTRGRPLGIVPED